MKIAPYYSSEGQSRPDYALSLPRIPAVYLVYSEQTCIYVGCTADLFFRFENHNKEPLINLHKSVKIKWEEGSDGEREIALISKLWPVYNFQRQNQLYNPPNFIRASRAKVKRKHALHCDRKRHIVRIMDCFSIASTLAYRWINSIDSAASLRTILTKDDRELSIRQYSNFLNNFKRWRLESPIIIEHEIPENKISYCPCGNSFILWSWNKIYCSRACGRRYRRRIKCQSKK